MFEQRTRLITTGLRGAIWTSADGLEWTRVPDERLPDAGEEAVQLVAVATRGPGLVAVGWRAQDDEVDAVVWTSTDGEIWNVASDEGGTLRSPGGQLMADVIAGGSGLVAVGADGSERSLTTAVWTSP